MNCKCDFLHAEPNMGSVIDKIWEECGTSVYCVNVYAAEKEIEFFVEKLMKRVAEDLEKVGVDGVYETMKMIGYIKGKND